jgi:hypothetical protein
MIKKAIISRIAQSIERRSFQNFMFNINKLVFCAWIFLLLFWHDMIHAIDLKQYEVFAGVYLIANVYAFFETILSCISYIRKNRPKFSLQIDDYVTKKEKSNTQENTIDGISQTGLIDFLLKQNWFPFVIAKSKFWLFPKEYKKIGDNLERVWILVRGENNARILKQNVDRELLEKIITKSNSDDLTPPLLREGNTFTIQNI